MEQNKTKTKIRRKQRARSKKKKSKQKVKHAKITKLKIQRFTNEKQIFEME
jgi:hypothetical protein